MSTSSNDLAYAVNDLAHIVQDLPDKDRAFATSLVAQFRAKNSLSSKQRYWVDRLLTRGLGVGSGGETSDSVDGVGGLFSHFDTAAEHLKYPKMILQPSSDFPALKISRAGEKSKFPGALNLSAASGDSWFGRLHRDGSVQWSKYATAEQRTSILEILQRLASDPAGYASAVGKLMGSCCFCKKDLTTSESLLAGYGPVCAKKYNLPWG